MIEYIGIAAGVLTSISLLPQLIKILKEKKAKDISIVYLLILLAGLGFWIWYGFLRDDLPIVITNCISVILNVSILILGIKYKDRSAS